jgi:putative transposase
VGIDLGVEELVATSAGELMANPRHLRHSLKRLAAAQRLVAGRKRGSHRRRKAAARVGALHRKVAAQRRNLHHHVSKDLVARYDLIVHEDLAITNMTKRPAPRPNDHGGFDPNGAAAKAGLNREILGSGWGQLLRMLSYKAEEAGRDVISVDPRYTSQTCPRCKQVDAASRVGAVFQCTTCGHKVNAHVNAAENILRAGLALRHAREAEREVA